MQILNKRCFKKNFHKGTIHFRHRSEWDTLKLEDKKQIKKAKSLI